MAARRPDGQIVLERQTVQPWSDRLRFLKWPFFRGAVVFFESLVLGMKALEWSGRQALPEEETSVARTVADERRDRWLMGVTLALGVVFGLVLFGIVPYYAAQFTSGRLSGGGGRLAFNLINGGYKISVFLLYLWLMSWIPDLRRVFMYHGAEHKSIFAWEDGEVLTAVGAAAKSRFHPRCSTAFLLMVILVAILVFALVLPRGLSLPARLAGELVLMLPISGLTYELQRLSARHCQVAWVRWLSQPGLVLQGMTTREPDAAQLEVALAALKAVLEMEGRKEESHVG